MLGGLEKVCHETRSVHGSLPLQLLPNPTGCSLISDIPSDRMEGSITNSRCSYALRYALAYIMCCFTDLIVYKRVVRSITQLSSTLIKKLLVADHMQCNRRLD
jgi:hypothetical protein